VRKLFLLGSFITIFLFLTGCQSEMPISPIDDDFTLDKIKVLSFTTENQISGTGFVSVKLDWSPVRNAAGYKVTFTNLMTGSENTITLDPTVVSYTANYVMLQHQNASCNIKVEAYKMRKGVELITHEGIQTITYTGAYLDELTFTGYLQDAPLLIYFGNIQPWVAENFNKYQYTFLPSWSTSLINSNWFYLIYYNSFNAFLPSPGRPLTADDYVVVTLYKYDYYDNLINIGNKKVFYVVP
jgi:hypothetical protein